MKTVLANPPSSPYLRRGGTPAPSARSFGSAMALASLLMFVLSAATGCLEDFDPPSLINSLRVLAIRAEPPELWPGESAELSALVVRPAQDGEALVNGDDLQYEWAACITSLPFGDSVAGGSVPDGGQEGDGPPPPPTEMELYQLTNPPPSCFHSDDVLSIPLAQGEGGSRATLTLPAIPIRFPEEFGRLPVIAGLWLTISLRVTDPSDGSEVITNKRLVIKPHEDDRAPAPEAGAEGKGELPLLCVEDPILCARNENPPPPEVEVPESSSHGKEVELLPEVLEDHMQRYVDLMGFAELGEVERKEAFYFSWFSTQGTFSLMTTYTDPDDDENVQTEWKAPSSKESRGDQVVLFVVVRDGRGGTQWSQHQLTLTQ